MEYDKVMKRAWKSHFRNCAVQFCTSSGRRTATLKLRETLLKQILIPSKDDSIAYTLKRYRRKTLLRISRNNESGPCAEQVIKSQVTSEREHRNLLQLNLNMRDTGFEEHSTQGISSSILPMVYSWLFTHFCRIPSGFLSQVHWWDTTHVILNLWRNINILERFQYSLIQVTAEALELVTSRECSNSS